MATTRKKAATTDKAPRKRTARVAPVAAIEEDSEVIIQPSPTPVEPTTKTKYWMVAVVAGLAMVLLTILIWPDPKPHPIEPDNTEKIRLLEQAVKAQSESASKDSAMRELRKELSEIEFKKVTNNNYYVKSNEELKKVRSNNARLTADSLRSKVTKLTGNK